MATTSIENDVQKLSLEQSEAEKMTSKMDEQAGTIKSLLALLGASDLKKGKSLHHYITPLMLRKWLIVTAAQANVDKMNAFIKECIVLKKENMELIIKIQKVEYDHAELGFKHDVCDDKAYLLEQEIEKLRKENLELRQKVELGEEGDAEANATKHRQERIPKRSRREAALDKVIEKKQSERMSVM
jgi:hypothetical protein